MSKRTTKMTQTPHDDIQQMSGLNPGDDGEVSPVTVGANPEAFIELLKVNGALDTASLPRDKLGESDDEPSDESQEDPTMANKPQAGTGEAGAAGKPNELTVKFSPEQIAEIQKDTTAQIEKMTSPLVAQIEALQKENVALKAKTKKDGDLAAFAETLPEAFRAAFMAMSPEEQAGVMDQYTAMAQAGAPNPTAKLAEQYEAQAKKLAAQDAEIAKLRDEQDQQAAVTKYAKLAKAVEPQEFARNIRKVAKLDPKLADYFVEKLTALDAQARMGKAFKVEGVDGAPADDSAVAKIAKLAAEKMKADPKMTKAKAQDLILRADPELFQQYQNERGA